MKAIFLFAAFGLLLTTITRLRQILYIEYNLNNNIIENYGPAFIQNQFVFVSGVNNDGKTIDGYDCNDTLSCNEVICSEMLNPEVSRVMLLFASVSRSCGHNFTDYLDRFKNYAPDEALLSYTQTIQYSKRQKTGILILSIVEFVLLVITMSCSRLGKVSKISEITKILLFACISISLVFNFIITTHIIINMKGFDNKVDNISRENFVFPLFEIGTALLCSLFDLLVAILLFKIKNTIKRKPFFNL
jgi:hypothetical protein